MTRLKLSDITDGKPVKLTIEIPQLALRPGSNLFAYPRLPRVQTHSNKESNEKRRISLKPKSTFKCISKVLTCRRFCVLLQVAE